MAEVILFIYLASIVGLWILIAIGVKLDEIDTYGELFIFFLISFIPLVGSAVLLYIGWHYFMRLSFWNKPIKKVKK